LLNALIGVRAEPFKRIRATLRLSCDVARTTAPAWRAIDHIVGVICVLERRPFKQSKRAFVICIGNHQDPRDISSREQPCADHFNRFKPDALPLRIGG
jgi:hypothetical protein